MNLIHKLFVILIVLGPVVNLGFFLVMSLSLLAMVLRCGFSLGAPSLVAWVVIACT